VLAGGANSGRDELMKESKASCFVLLLLAACLFQSVAEARKTLTEEPEMVSFGTGSVRVRLYTDYFCGPCSGMEPRIEEVLTRLVRKKTITLTFVDTPVHRMTPLYARYFLYAINADKSFKEALRCRTVLFAAARERIEDKGVLEDHLKKSGIKFREMDPAPVFAAFSAMMQEDDIKSTPTCVVVREGNKGVFSGEAEITKALRTLE
jgi:thiol:disulfide interchange protein DsbA